MEISVIPLGTGSTSVGQYIVEIERYLRQKGLSPQLTDMGTILEGSPEELFQWAREIHELLFSKGLSRIYTVIKIDDRRDKKVVLGEKTRRVEESL